MDGSKSVLKFATPIFLRAKIRPLNIKATWTNIKSPIRKLVRGEGCKKMKKKGGGYFKGCRVGLTNGPVCAPDEPVIDNSK